MQHTITARTYSTRDDIEQRLTGRFFTPLSVAEQLAWNALQLTPHPEIVMDPFCGDGRLVSTWIRTAAKHGALSRLRKIILWDYDLDLVSESARRIRSELATHGLGERITIQAECGDSFARQDLHATRADIVLTNPPWDLLKPDTRDALAAADSRFRSEIRLYARHLALRFPGTLSAKGKAISGYGVNLARAGAVLSAMLVRKGGTLSIVLPSSIFADQASVPFRSQFLSTVALHELTYYPAETRLFDGVDQPFVTAVALGETSTSSFRLKRLQKDCTVLDERHVELPELSDPIALTVSESQESIVRQLRTSQTQLAALEEDRRFGLWLGRELDETRVAEAFTNARSGVPFLKGKHVFPYKISRSENWRIDPRKRKIPPTVQMQRIAWRDVSRPNQRRRMHVARVPDGFVTGNSLGVAYFKERVEQYTPVLLGLMNSLIFELQVRTSLATAHVSQGILRRCCIPLDCFQRTSLAEKLRACVEAQARANHELPELEVLVAKYYGLGRDDFEAVLNAFPKITLEERAAYLERRHWL